MTRLYVNKTDEDYMFDFMDDREIIERAKPRNYSEEVLLQTALKELGTYTTVEKLANFLNISKPLVYKFIDQKKLIKHKVGERVLILTRTILNVLKECE